MYLILFLRNKTINNENNFLIMFFNSCPIEDNIVEMKDETILIEDNNSIELIGDEGLDVSKECVITALNPIEDFNKLLENGFDSTIGIFKFAFSY